MYSSFQIGGLYFINKEAFSKKMKFAIYKRTFEKKKQVQWVLGIQVGKETRSPYGY